MKKCSLSGNCIILFIKYYIVYNVVQMQNNFVGLPIITQLTVCLIYLSHARLWFFYCLFCCLPADISCISAIWFICFIWKLEYCTGCLGNRKSSYWFFFHRHLVVYISAFTADTRIIMLFSLFANTMISYWNCIYGLRFVQIKLQLSNSTKYCALSSLIEERCAN